jgi:hypothetical protein
VNATFTHLNLLANGWRTIHQWIKIIGEWIPVYCPINSAALKDEI